MGRVAVDAHAVRWNKNDAHTFGFWGTPSTTLDWCELNYSVSHYIAEFFNTLSNLFFIYLSISGLIRARSQKLPISLQLGPVVIGLVGSGSFAFHATLSYEWQLADELPMIYAVTTVLYTILALPKSSRTPLQLHLIRAALFSYASGLTIVYTFIYPNPVLHQVAYGFIQLVLTIRSIYITHSTWGRALISSEKLSQINRLFRNGVAIFILGFALWNVDNIFCDHLSNAKKIVGPLLAWALEGHAWWHIFTGYGSFLSVIAIQFLAACINEGQDNFRLRGYWFPWIQRIQHKKAE